MCNAYSCYSCMYRLSITYKLNLSISHNSIFIAWQIPRPTIGTWISKAKKRSQIDNGTAIRKSNITNLHLFRFHLLVFFLVYLVCSSSPNLICPFCVIYASERKKKQSVEWSKWNNKFYVWINMHKRHVRVYILDEAENIYFICFLIGCAIENLINIRMTA